MQSHCWYSGFIKITERELAGLSLRTGKTGEGFGAWYVNSRCRERFPHHRLQKKPLVSDPGMHHGTCVTYAPWCMSGSLTYLCLFPMLFTMLSAWALPCSAARAFTRDGITSLDTRGLVYYHGLTQITPWVVNCTHWIVLYIITYPCPHFNLKLGHGRVFTSHCFT